MKQVGWLLSGLTWLLLAGSIVVLTGGVFGRPLLLAAVPTGSMVPVFNPGDMIVVLPTWVTGSAGLGDIVVFKTPADRNWVVHRIIDGNGLEGFVTKGDANQLADPERVYAKDMAGKVPQWQGKALRLPRLGLLSVSQGPLSSPVVAGVALVMGVYLLVLDIRPSAAWTGRVPRRRARATSEALLFMYLGLSATAFITTLVPAWTLSTTQQLRYEVVAQKPIDSRSPGRYLKGQSYTEEVPVKNPSPLPLVVVFATEDSRVSYAPSVALVPPRTSARFMVNVQAVETGLYESQVNMGVFLPLLPPAVIGWLGASNMALAAVVCALVPMLLLLALALFDARCRQALSHAWLRLRLRLT